VSDAFVDLLLILRKCMVQNAKKKKGKFAVACNKLPDLTQILMAEKETCPEHFYLLN
jgi:hypothetical protein